MLIFFEEKADTQIISVNFFGEGCLVEKSQFIFAYIIYQLNRLYILLVKCSTQLNKNKASLAATKLAAVQSKQVRRQTKPTRENHELECYVSN
jgi:hypothetical protein